MTVSKLKKVGCARCSKWNEIELDILRTVVSMFQEEGRDEEKLEKLWLPIPILQNSCKKYTNEPMWYSNLSSFCEKAVNLYMMERNANKIKISFLLKEIEADVEKGVLEIKPSGRFNEVWNVIDKNIEEISELKIDG